MEVKRNKMASAMCYSLLGQTVALTETSAIHLFGLQRRRLGLVVAVACPMSR